MNLKKKFRDFFTLTRKADGGFTLVELIVVIAIIAILAGVAVPAYSGYITKTNKQADISLVADIEHALTLAYYNGDIVEGDAGFLMLMPASAEDSAPIYDETTGLALAMEKSFGANWPDMMLLKHNDWGVKNMLLNSADATAVVNSTFTQKYSPEELMAQVQAITDAANGLQVEIGDTEITLYDMFSYEDSEGAVQNVIEDVIVEYGITKDWDELSSTEKSNLLVLATASSISSGTSTDAAGVIPQYALYTAYAAENAEFKAAYQTFQTTIANVDPESADSQYDQIKNAYKTLQQAAKDNSFDTWNSSNGTENRAAFTAIMAGVGNAMKDNGDAILADLGNANMFTTGVGSELYNDYLNSAYASAGTVAGEDPYSVADMVAMVQSIKGSAAVWYNVINGMIYIDNTFPLSK